MIFVNTRVLSSHTTGVQRYIDSILKQLPDSYMNEVGFFNPNNLSGAKGHLWEQLVLPCKLNRDDVLWSPSNTGPIYCNAKHVVTMHDFATLDYPEWTSKSFSTLYQFLLPRLAKRADAIIAISEYTKSRILYHTGIDEKKISVIKNGVDDRFFIKTGRDFKSQIMPKYNIPSERYILSVSSIEPRKNISSLLRAWEKIQHQVDDDIWLVLVGRQNPKIFSNAGLNNIPERVCFTGFVDDEDLTTLYQNALLFSYVSLYEGFGLPPLEAMAAGIPVLTSNTTSIPEVVGDKAIIVNPLSVSEIAENLLVLLGSDSLRNNLSLAGIEHAKQFSWKTTAEQTFNLLKSME